MSDATPKENVFYAALDPGQKQDFCALSILERPLWYQGQWLFVSSLPDVSAIGRLFNPYNWGQPASTGDPQAEFPVRLVDLHRWPLGVSYVDIVEDTARLLQPMADLPHVGLVFLLDVVGVGAPVKDLFVRRTELPKPVEITTTGGTEVVKRTAFDLSIPKRDLVMSGIVMLESDRIRWPARLAHRDLLESELKNFQMKYSTHGNELFEAARQTHDDLVLSFSVACWAVLHARSRPRQGYTYSGATGAIMRG